MNEAAPRDVIAEWLALTDGTTPAEAFDYDDADRLIAHLAEHGYHITHDPTPTQRAARIRKRRHLGSWSGWPRRNPR